MSSSAVSEGATWFAEVTGDALDVVKYTGAVHDPGAGAIASFIGVTRDNFQGKAVEKLEYEAYVPMALKKLVVSWSGLPLDAKLMHENVLFSARCTLGALQEICQLACEKWDLKKIAVAHRTGTVLIGEASVIIVASSPHRRDALEVGTAKLRHQIQTVQLIGSAAPVGSLLCTS